MRVALLLFLVVMTGCLNTASSSQLESVGSVKVNPPIPPFQNPDVVKQLPGTGPVSCAATDGGTRFVDTTEQWNLGASGLGLVGNRLTVADLDSDGYPDLIVHAVTSNLRQNIDTTDGGRRIVWQLMNRPLGDTGHRTFVDETGNGFFEVPGGSQTQYRSAQLAVFGDVDNDGDLDGFSGTYTDPNKPDTDPGDRSQILLNDGTGHFTLAPPSSTTPRGGGPHAHHQRHVHRRRSRRAARCVRGQLVRGVRLQLPRRAGAAVPRARRRAVQRRHHREQPARPTRPATPPSPTTARRTG